MSLLMKVVLETATAAARAKVRLLQSANDFDDSRDDWTESDDEEGAPQ